MKLNQKTRITRDVEILVLMKIFIYKQTIIQHSVLVDVYAHGSPDHKNKL
jgi:hypothetical protein